MVLVIAHRGASGLAPENTLAAFREALRYNVDMIELDVRLTRDGYVVVVHDRRTRRVGTKNKKIKKTKYTDLQAVDVGKKFNTQFAQERIPLLEEVIRGIGHQALLNIELKCSFKGRENDLLQLIHQNNIYHSVIVSSDNKKQLWRIRQLDKHIRLSCILNRPFPRYIKFGKEVSLYSFQPHRGLITKRFVRHCHQYHFKVFPWTINTMKGMIKYINWGVDGIITNYPDRLTELLKGWER